MKHFANHPNRPPCLSLGFFTGALVSFALGFATHFQTAAFAENIVHVDPVVVETKITIDSAQFAASGGQPKSCAQWKDIFLAHFNSIKDYFDAIKELEKWQLTLTTPATWDEKRRQIQYWNNRRNQLIQFIKSNSPSRFFSATEDTYKWSVPYTSLGLAMPVAPPLHGAEALISNNFSYKILLSGVPEMVYFDESLITLKPYTRDHLNIHVGYTSFEMQISLSPMERCFTDPQFSGYLGPTGDSLHLPSLYVVIPVTKWLFYKPNSLGDTYSFGQNESVTVQFSF